MRTRDIERLWPPDKERIARMKAERLEAEAQRWASLDRFSIGTLQRFIRAIIQGAAGRDMQPVEGDLIQVLDRAIQIKKETKK